MWRDSLLEIDAVSLGPLNLLSMSHNDSDVALIRFPRMRCAAAHVLVGGEDARC